MAQTAYQFFHICTGGLGQGIMTTRRQDEKGPITPAEKFEE
jgi:hypothetical protein